MPRASVKDAGVSLYSGVRTRKAASVRKRQTEVVPRSYLALCQIHFWQRAFLFPLPQKQEVFSMTLYEELKARGLVAQITDE